MNIIEIGIEEIKPYENNPRINSGAVYAVANSIKEFGFLNPIIIDRNNEIIAGHTRYAAARLLELEKIPAVRVEDLTEDQVRAFRLVDNKTAELSGWDWEKLDKELLKIENVDIESMGFSLNTEDLDIDSLFEEKKKYKCPCCGMEF
jgi:ParB/RepB/Spo0J family partition protein